MPYKKRKGTVNHLHLLLKITVALILDHLHYDKIFEVEKEWECVLRL